MWPGAESTCALGLTALAGWLWGSFLNQLVDRTPYLGTPPASAVPGPPPDVTPWRPARSLCFACRRAIPWSENMPIVSYLLLRGRCRGCGAPIGRRTLVLEVATPLVLTAWHALVLTHGGSLRWLAWGLLTASWLLLATTLAAERRRLRPGFVALGGVLIAGALVACAAKALRW